MEGEFDRFTYFAVRSLVSGPAAQGRQRIQDRIGMASKSIQSKAGDSVPAALIPRLSALRQRMAELKLDAYLLTHAPDIAQFTGFSGHDSTALITPTGQTVVTDSRYTEELSLAAPHARLVLRTKSMADALTQAIGKAKSTRIGFETNFITYGLVDGLKRSLRKSGKSAALVPVTDMMVTLRKNKDSDEIAAIRKAVEIAEKAFLEVVSKVKPGVSESELTGKLILAMRSRGASDAAFHPIIATGAHSSLPHYRPDATPVANDAALLVDWGAIYQGYRSDLTRTVFIGKPNRKLVEIYKIVLEANLATIDKLKAGLNCKAADAIARKIITRAGYGKQFGHGLGHGIGRDIHEEPRLHASRDKDHLQTGSVVTVEPGIYLPGIGGVRIEDDVLITDTGCEVLSSLEKSLDSATSIVRG